MGPGSDGQWLDDVMTLLDGFNEEFCNNNTHWSVISKKEKEEWFSKFATEHAHYIGVDGKWL